MKIGILVLVLLGWSSSVWAEGIWDVNGYQLSNVHAWQQNNKIIVGGRVASGPPCNLLTIRVLATSDQGDSVTLPAFLGKYTGNGELFEASRVVYHKSGYWKVEAIDIQAQGQRNSGPRMQSPPPALFRQREQDAPVSDSVPHSYTTYQNSRVARIDNPSRVLFSSEQPVNIIVREKKSNKVALIKNIEPHRSEEVQMKRGHYVAKIIGQGMSREIEFTVQGDNEVIDLK